MTTDQTTRGAELAAQFAASRRLTAEQPTICQAIVREMLTFMSQGDAAELLGISRQRVSQIAAGK